MAIRRRPSGKDIREARQTREKLKWSLWLAKNRIDEQHNNYEADADSKELLCTSYRSLMAASAKN